MLFSIVTPVRNNLPGIRRCVGSVRGQGRVDLEHLIQDCKSTDGTAEWLASQAGLATVSEADRGMYDAIARGWSRAKGEVLSWLNSDEQYLPGALERIQEVFTARPKVDVVWADAIVVNGVGDPLAARREIPLRRSYVANTFLNSMSCTMFFRRRLHDSGLLSLDSTYRSAGDMELVLSLLDRGVTFAHLPAYVALFGFDGQNMSLRPEAELEAEKIRLAHGAFRSSAMRRLFSLARYLERFLRGCYRPVTLSYDYAIDETPSFRRVVAQGVGGRYTAKSLGMADR